MPSWKCKFKLLGNTASAQAEWLSLASLTTDARVDMERKETFFTVDGGEGAN